ncbi:MAG: hypothetical protein KF855_01730 [Acidobacteria bacterium]|nr:hypothetical protein [Acidobacteriota bacterium]
MRTTLDIEDDILQAAKELAEYEKTTTGKMLSRLARKGLTGNDRPREMTFRNGVPVLPSRGKIVTNEMINKIREEEGI